MGILAQHGAQKGDKLNRGLASGVIDGVIFSPKNETPDNLALTIGSLQSRFQDKIFMLDTQFFLNLLPEIEPGKFDRYLNQLYFHPLTRRDLSNPRKLQGYVSAVINYQRELPFSHIMTPGVLIENFQDKSSQINISLMEESLEFYSSVRESRPLMLSLNITETAFDSEADLNEFLDILTGLDRVGGFYVVINSPDPDHSFASVQTLEKFLYFIYALSELNGFNTVIGFTGPLGLLFEAIGASHVGVGWFKKQQGFSINHHLPTTRTGGRAAIPRYFSAPLLDNIKIVPTLASIHLSGDIEEVATHSQFDRQILLNPVPDDWPLEVSVLHLWDSLKKISDEIKRLGSITNRLDYLQSIISNAMTSYESLLGSGVQFEFSSIPLHLRQWSQAISIFRGRLGI